MVGVRSRQCSANTNTKYTCSDYMYIHTNIIIYVCEYIHIYIKERVYVCAHAWKPVGVYSCSVARDIHAFIHTHTHAHIHEPLVLSFSVCKYVCVCVRQFDRSKSE